MLNPYKGEWHEQISEEPEYCAICKIDPNHPSIPEGEMYWLWELDETHQVEICSKHHDLMYQLFDLSQE